MSFNVGLMLLSVRPSFYGIPYNFKDIFSAIKKIIFGRIIFVSELGLKLFYFIRPKMDLNFDYSMWNTILFSFSKVKLQCI